MATDILLRKAVRFEVNDGFLQFNTSGSFLVGGAITILRNMSSSMGRMTSHI